MRLVSVLCFLFIAAFKHFVCAADGDFNSIIIIYGQLRTFSLTCGGIFENVVKQNAPAKVIINIDGGETERRLLDQDKNIKQCLRYYEGVIDFIVEGINKKTALHHGMEFDLMDRALDLIELNHYHARYIIKVRSDNFINAPIDIAAAFGLGSSFMYKFVELQHQYAKLVRSHKETTVDTSNSPVVDAGLVPSFVFADHLWAWVFTAGIPQLLRPMLFEPSPSPWSFLNATAWNENMKSYIYATYNRSLPVSVAHEYYGYSDLVVSALADIHSKYEVVYLMGRTWVHFGRYNTIAKISRDIVPDYGRLAWNVSGTLQKALPPGYQWPFKDDKLVEEGKRYNTFEWREVTESQLRLEHLKHGVNLVDMQNRLDDEYSFTMAPGSVYEFIGDDRVVAFLLRTCSNGHNPRSDCNYSKLEHR
jgi:hypothetical protein